MWLAVASLALIFIPLLRVGARLGAETGRLEETVISLQATLEGEPAPLPEVEGLEADASQIEGDVSAVEAIYAELQANHFDWSAAMVAIANYDADKLMVSGVSQSGNRIELSGQALDENVVLAYAGSLASSVSAYSVAFAVD